MRTVWWCAAALALLAVTNALRTTQVEGATRYNRRLPSPTAADVRSSTEAEPSDAAPTVKPRSSRRQEIPQRDVRTRSQSRRPLQRIEASTEADPSQPRDERNERHDSKRISSRTRSRNLENTTTEAPAQREPINRSRTRQGIRKTQYSPPQRSSELSSSPTDDSKADITNIDRITTARKENNAENQFRRRSSSVQTVETVAPKKLRGRINTRPNARSLDLDVSGTTNALSNYEKEPTTARTSDLRNSRKLRYKQRLSETDTNLTGEGITASNEVIKSSQKNENIPSQPENQTPVQIVFAETQPTVQSSTETLPIISTTSTTTKAIKVLKRPLARGKGNFKPSVTAHKVHSTDEINEDDNYPESFKALIQAKNASTQASSPSSESLTLKASQKIYKTYATSSQSNTGTSSNKYSRLRNKLNIQDETKNDYKKEDSTKQPVASTPVTPTPVASTPETIKTKKAEFRPRGTFNPRSRKLTSFTSTTTNSLAQSTSKPAYKYSRKFKLTTTESPKKETIARSSVESSSTLKKAFVRPTVYSRKSYNRKNFTTTERSSEEKSKNTEATNVKPKVIPRTSYYSRFRNNKNKTSSAEASKEVTNDTRSVESKTEATDDKPLIFTLLNNSEKNNTLVSENQIKNNESKDMFIIAVTSKESQEQNIVSEPVHAIEESGHKLVINENPSTVKYHAIYKDPNSMNHLENIESSAGSTTPIVRNLQTGRTTRKRTKLYEKDIDIPNTVTPKMRERNLKKYSDSYVKPLEDPTSVISSEPDKVKGRFSSKFRASYLDKPFYKPTVPSVTSTSTPTTTEAVKISTTFSPRRPTTTRSNPTTVSAMLAPVSTVVSTTEIATTSTFSVEEDLAFLKNLKSVLKANPSNDDPEAALANRIIALAVERSLNEIQTGPDVRTGKKIANNGVQETTTQRNKLALTGQTSDEALKKLLQQQSSKTGMVSEATQPPMSLSTEYGKSNDALLAALLKEQGFGPTTASSLDEQLRLSALLNQVVVTPKARRTTTPPPPPPPPRRPVLDGLAWLWQQWRDTAPGPTAGRPNRRPNPSSSPSVATSAATSNRVNWFGSGPFVGNADDKPSASANRIPLEPPAAVTSEQTPGRGQLVSAAINVTRAFSQFLGAAIQGAAQTVQSVIRAGQRAATDVYVNGSGGSG